MGKLIDVTRELGLRYLGVQRSATLAEVASEDGWNIRRCAHRRYPQLCDKLAVTARPVATLGPDIVLWRHGQDDLKPVFSASKTWEYLRAEKAVLPWHRIVWFPQAIPRQSFMVWLAFKDRLSTGIRMRSWGVEQVCVYCGEKDESRDHLFFACPYTFTVWTNVAERLLGAAITPDWADTVTSIMRPNRNQLDTVLIRLVFQTAIYMLWRERNSRRHGGANMSVALITKNIGKMVKNRISSLKYRGNHKLEGLLRRWFTITAV